MYILIQRSSAINVDDLDNEELWQAALDATNEEVDAGRQAAAGPEEAEGTSGKEHQGRGGQETGDSDAEANE